MLWAEIYVYKNCCGLSSVTILSHLPYQIFMTILAIN